MRSKKIIHLTEENFEKYILETKGLLLIECYSNKSGQFHIMRPVLEKMKEFYQKEISYFQLNIEELVLIQNEFLLFNDTTYLMFKNGKLVEKISGIIPSYEFRQILEYHLTSK